jgi:RNA polymerase sigma-70 factor (ECF subfamily)
VSARFQTTNWSLVLAARGQQSADSRDALAWLCEAYWYPIYAFVRHKGHGAEDARDLTQGYFATLLEKGYLDDVQPEAGRFRSFLFASVSHFLANEHDRARTAKRGGGRVLESLDADAAEEKYRFEPVDHLTPEKVYEKQWALATLGRALARLEEEHASADATVRFQALRPYLTGDDTAAAYRDLAPRLGLTEAAVRQAVRRLRKRYGELLRKEIGQTVAEPAAVDDELRHLLSALQ